MKICNSFPIVCGDVVDASALQEALIPIVCDDVVVASTLQEVSNSFPIVAMMVDTA